MQADRYIHAPGQKWKASERGDVQTDRVNGRRVKKKKAEQRDKQPLTGCLSCSSTDSWCLKYNYLVKTAFDRVRKPDASPVLRLGFSSSILDTCVHLHTHVFMHSTCSVSVN